MHRGHSEYWMHYSKFSRDIIAEIFVTRLWDNGFQNITIFGNRVYHKKQWVKHSNVIITSRQDLFNKIKFGIVSQVDIHFAKLL